MKKVELVMEVYTLEEILEANDVTQEEALIALVEVGLVKLPEIQPLE